MMRLAMIVSRVRTEEKLLLEAFQRLGVEPEVISDDGVVLDPVEVHPSWLQEGPVPARPAPRPAGPSPPSRPLGPWRGSNPRPCSSRPSDRGDDFWPR